MPYLVFLTLEYGYMAKCATYVLPATRFFVIYICLNICYTYVPQMLNIYMRTYVKHIHRFYDLHLFLTHMLLVAV